MSRIGQVVTVRGERYRIDDARNLSHLGSKFFGRFAFELVKVSDGTRWEVYGKSVAHNSRISAKS